MSAYPLLWRLFLSEFDQVVLRQQAILDSIPRSHTLHIWDDPMNNTTAPAAPKTETFYALRGTNAGRGSYGLFIPASECGLTSILAEAKRFKTNAEAVTWYRHQSLWNDDYEIVKVTPTITPGTPTYKATPVQEFAKGYFYAVWCTSRDGAEYSGYVPHKFEYAFPYPKDPAASSVFKTTNFYVAQDLLESLHRRYPKYVDAFTLCRVEPTGSAAPTVTYTVTTL